MVKYSCRFVLLLYKDPNTSKKLKVKGQQYYFFLRFKFESVDDQTFATIFFGVGLILFQSVGIDFLGLAKKQKESQYRIKDNYLKQFDCTKTQITYIMFIFTSSAMIGVSMGKMETNDPPLPTSYAYANLSQICS